MTREQAANYYTKLAKDYNQTLQRCRKTLEPWSDAGSYQGPMKRLVANVRDDCGEFAEVNRKHARLLEQAAWPAEVTDAMDDLVTYTRATQFAFDQLAEARTWEDVTTALQNMPADPGAADLVRAHLGLQKREKQ